MIIDVRAELENAANKTVYGNIGLASDPRGYISANSSPDTAKRALDHLEQLSDGGAVTALHFKQAIQDFREASQSLYRAGKTELGDKASNAFNILVETYINATGDVDVYRALPDAQTLEIS